MRLKLFFILYFFTVVTELDKTSSAASMADIYSSKCEMFTNATIQSGKRQFVLITWRVERQISDSAVWEKQTFIGKQNKGKYISGISC